ncbi:sensor histidine kinase [Mycetocola zhadangensis]|uniref:Sensor-like histidine kinase SenX3 n=1 Tax=Mycetocola zhadangensis TaxID=1164595 RepID=A0A3L7J052_9MICO|nr:PAS domain-containing sensor histidine kinase [Mycetocola zhadangensis]RLQ82742.1 PAS domain-containing sensor histidine kinase [Mycetocola zhadangensis]GGE98593.1 two-component sensor histidine kinase [Mycetocola zhadangensis]
MSLPLTKAPPSSRWRLERSVFLWQLLLAGAVLLLVCIAMTIPQELARPEMFFFGVVLVFATTAAAGVIPWGRLGKKWTILVPVFDIVAVVILRTGEPSLGSGFFLVLPVLWMATYYGLFGAILGPAVSMGALIGGLFLMDQTSITTRVAGALVIPIVLVFVSTATFLGTRKTQAQRVLLRQQAELLESAFDRARRDERTLDQVMNTVSFGVVAVNRFGRPTIVNSTYRRWLSAFGTPATSYFPAVDYGEDGVTPLEPGERPHERMLRGDSFENLIVWYGEPGEKRLALGMTSRPLTNAEGQREGAVMVSRDLTAEIDAIRARDDLVASVSHELRTPLTSILGYLELVLDGESITGQDREYVDVALNNADRMLSIVSDLLLASQEEHVGFLLNFAPTNLAVLAKQSIQSLKPVADERRISLLLTSIGSPIVYADEFRVRQVIDNLLSNAVKYNHTGGRVSVAVIGDEREVEIFISDTGRGMTAEEQKNLFQRFYRAESVRNSSVHGTGLGLAISQEIVRAHEGDIRMSASSPAGTTMVITIPREQQEE